MLVLVNCPILMACGLLVGTKINTYIPGIGDINVDSQSTNEAGPLIDNIKTKHRSKSGRPADVEDHGKKTTSPYFPRPSEPWWPSFGSREDFEVAGILREASINPILTTRLLKVIQVCISGKGKLTFSSHEDVEEAWQRLSHQFTPVHTEPSS
jgi:hypothetical protein